MNGIKVAPWILAFVLSTATLARADVDLQLPREPERSVVLPGPGMFTGARFYAPEGKGPHPAVVISHTCGGLRQHILEWAQRFLLSGYVVLVVDHLGPRGSRNNCFPSFEITVTRYAQDAVAAAKHLSSMPFVDPKRIFLLGFSYGAQAGLRIASRSFRESNLGGAAFPAIVSVYPWCNERRGPTFREHQWNFFDDTDLPLLVILGADDNEADPASCVKQATANAAKGLPVEHVVLPGTTHGFDHSLMGDKPFTRWDGDHMVTYRYNAVSVERGWKLMSEFFARHMR